METKSESKSKVALLKSEGETFRMAAQISKSLLEETRWDCKEVVVPVAETWAQIERQLEPFDVVVLAPSLREKAAKGIPSRSVESHFLVYSDFLVRKNGIWWSQALQSQVFHHLLMEVLRIRDFRGPVIFLGENVLVSPILQILCQFSFTEISFLDLQADPRPIEVPASLKQVHISRVDSAAFIQSQKEYALCIICEPEFSKEVLEDMSYFHFLSPRSTVFDMSGGSNFQEDEVKALGVHYVSAEDVSAVEIDMFVQRVRQGAAQ